MRTTDPNPGYKFGTVLTEQAFDEGLLPTTASVGVIMGSDSDWNTVEPCCDMLERLEIRFEYGVVSAHRTPERMTEYVSQAESRGLKVVAACAGGSCHLQGMSSSHTTLLVLGFAPLSEKFGPWDVLGSCVRMPAGVPLPFIGFDKAGAVNTALTAARALAIADEELRKRLVEFREAQRNDVPYSPHMD